MPRNGFLKLLALLLCAACLLTALASGFGILALAATGYYTGTPQQVREDRMRQDLSQMGHNLVRRYLEETLGGMPEEYLDHIYDLRYDYPYARFDPAKWSYRICDDNGAVLYAQPGAPTDRAPDHTEGYVPNYREVTDILYRNAQTNEVDPVRSTTTDMERFKVGSYYHFQFADGTDIHFNTQWRDSGQWYQVDFFLEDGAYTAAQSEGWARDLLETGYYWRYTLIVVCLVSLLAFLLLLLYLFRVAGKKPGSEEIFPGWLNRIPLDIYFGVGLPLEIGLAWGLVAIAESIQAFPNFWFPAALAAGLGYAGCLIAVCFLFAIAAQVKTPGGFWYKRSLLGGCVVLVNKFFLWLWPLCKKCLGAIFGLVRSVFQACRELLSDLLRLLPLTWQWLLGAGVLLLVMLWTVASRSGEGFLLGAAVIAAVVLYGAHCFGVLFDRAKKMSQGDLEGKIEDSQLIGAFRDFGMCLNALSQVTMDAARNQMRSERMKAELVTNVSHDIKTPLTSIINYVDLLQKAKSEQEKQEYLAVLDRQSQRLKKLIEDLMEMSKASTGNMTVELSSVDPAEAVNQALGEFADKLEASSIRTVFQPPQPPLSMRCDGRLTWRVLSNLLSNAVKYAMPGTRLYIDIAKVEGHILISLKNISREPLNISSEELMERFVRGDESRNTEGSGLGLNIAKSLMELQKGQLQLLVDGDFFKVTLLFPES